MIKTEVVVQLIKTEGKLSFDKIWSKLKNEVMAENNKSKDQEAKLKSDFYVSMIQNEKLIMIGNNVWNLREEYNNEQIAKINENLLGEELIKESENIRVEDDDEDVIAEVEEELGNEEEE